MARPRTKTRRMTVKELVRQQRGELYATGHQNLNMALPSGLIDEIDTLKKRYRLRSRDAVVARIIRQCMATVSPDDFVQREADGDATLRRISPIVENELADYVQQVQRRFRNMPYGPVFEMIFAEIGSDLSNPAVQLELIQGGEQ